MSATERPGTAPARCVIALIALACGSSWAQPPAAGTVTEDDIAQARRAQPVITDAQIERARRTNRMPTEQELARVPIPATPHIDELPKPLSNRAIDLGALAKGYEAAVRAELPRVGMSGGPALLVFVSFSMPEKTLLRLVEQAARARGTLVLRGLVNGSLKVTVTHVQRLMGDRKVAFQIDPQAFDRFAVVAAPTFVLVHEGAQSTTCSAGRCFAPDAFVSMAGDVSLDYALEHFQRTAPAFKRDASTFLQRLQRG